MEIFSLTLDVNETREVALVGNYFELRNALSPVVLIELLDKNGAVVNLMRGALESDFVESRQFDTVRITNGATAQSVKFWYGVGSAGSRRFSGSVTGSVALDVATIAALIAGKYSVRPEVPTHTLNDATAAIIGTSAAPLVAVADNPSGLIILDGYLQDFAVTAQSMLAKISAPTAVNDGMCILSAVAPGYSSAGAVSAKITHPIFVPAGLGIWLRSDAATGAALASRRGLNYIKL